ncbi:MAG: flagellar hook-associated protein FlgK [Phycisphaeraceae bacterium]
MGLIGSLQIGKTGLLASQAALQVVGQNLANLATDGYHRQKITLAPERAQQIGPGLFIGRGVKIQSITRTVDEALEARLRGSISDQSASEIRQQLLGRIEAIENEFSGTDLSTALGEFFNAFSELANRPQDVSLRTLLLEQAGSLSGFIRDLDAELGQVQLQTIAQTDQAVETVNDLLDRIATLNQQISVQSRGSGGSPGLRDQRDQLLAELSKYLDISTVEQASGSVDVFVGSLPIILNNKSRGVELLTEEQDGETVTKVVIAADRSPLDITSGELGALIRFKEQDIQDAIDAIDTLAAQLIYQVNRLHSQGQGLDLLDGVTGATAVEDATAALNDLDSTGLTIAPTHGSFQVHVVQKSTGQVLTTTINVDLDGINPAGDTTLTSLAADIDAIANISASVTADGKLQITPDSGDFQISFSDDTSGALAVLGINTFFTGKDAFDINVNPVLKASPRLVAAAGSSADGKNPGDNSNALAMAALRDQPLTELNGLSLTQHWNRHVEDFAVRQAQARQQYQADTVIREGLMSQQQSVSGVNADEEAIDLLQYQRAYQASARLLTVIDEMLQTLIAAV